MITRRFIGGGAAVGAIGLLSLTIAGAGIAAAANGGSLILGHSNAATATTTLRDSHGTPLSLVGKASAPPLKVSSAKQVNHLNASLLGGKSAAQLATHGSGAQLPDSHTYSGESLTTGPGASTKIAATSELSPGTYFVSASAAVYDSTTDDTYCFVGKTANYTGALQFSGTSSTGNSELGETLVVTLSSPATLGEYCYTTGTDALAYDGGIYAIAVGHYTHGSAPSIVRRGGAASAGH
jgi:hypothetical protein